MATDFMDTEAAMVVMRKEFDWLLKKQIPRILKEIETVLKECDKTFDKKPKNTNEREVEKPNKFLLKTPSVDVLKGTVKVEGDSITNAELKFKVPKIANGVFNTFIKDDHPWKLNQVQDARNNIEMAIEKINEALTIGTGVSGTEINELVDELISFISRGKASLSIHEKQSVPELLLSCNGSQQKAFKPSLPDDVVVNFHVSCHKLIFTIYVLNTLSSTPPPSQKSQASDRISSTFEHNSKWYEIINRFEVDCVILWLADAFKLIAIALQLCQQVKDKIDVFSRLMDE